jgi:hypothetical protein
MKGQWMGPYTGANNCLLDLEIDDVADHYEGHGFAYSNAPEPVMVAELNIPKGLPTLKVRIPLVPLVRGTGAIMSQQHLAISYPNVTPPTYADSE